MQNQFVFEEKKEIERLRVQNKLLSDYEAPVFRALFSEKKGCNVLDIGCNDGKKTVERFSSDAVDKVIGLEYNEALAKKAEQSYGGEKFSFYSLNVEAPDFSARLTEIMRDRGIFSFDVIYLSFVLMHLSDANRLLDTVKPFLSPDGKLLIIEADDGTSTLSNDGDGLLGEFLKMLKKDKYSGNREVGAHICDSLSACGYGDVRVWQTAVLAGEGEREKKEDIFTTFFTYLSEDIQLLLAAEPENGEYKSWSRWMDMNYERLRALILSEDSVISMGIKILTCTGGEAAHTLTLENDQTFSLKPLSAEEVGEACRLCDECVGVNLYTKEELALAVGAEDRFFYFLKSLSGETVGYIYYYLAKARDIAEYARLDESLFLALDFDSKKKVGKIQSVGLRSEYRGLGISGRMTAFALKQLQRAGVEIAFIVCWKPGGVVPIAKALFECRFNYLAEAKKIWYDDTELICPYCKGRCLCDAEVYYKLLVGEINNEA